MFFANRSKGPSFGKPDRPSWRFLLIPISTNPQSKKSENPQSKKSENPQIHKPQLKKFEYIQIYKQQIMKSKSIQINNSTNKINSEADTLHHAK